MRTWISDANGNRCSVERWRSEEGARAALATLKGCHDCSDCSCCYGCSDCSDCHNCSDCSRCVGCSDSHGCSGCSGCSRCSRCSSCSRCYSCHGCSDCSRCCDSRDLRNAAPVQSAPAANHGPPPVPIVPELHARIFAAVSQPGVYDASGNQVIPQALGVDAWHTCEYTHCRAGWVVVLAGEAGRALEAFFDTPLAARKIYDASCPGYLINPCRFFDSNEDALEDMRKLAEAAQ